MEKEEKKEKKIKFKKYNIEFSEKDFDNLTNEDLKKCKEILGNIREELER